MGRLAPLEFAQFNGLLASAVERQVPLAPALSLLAAQTRTGALRRGLETAARALQEGRPLPEALSASPDLFPPEYVALLDAGLRSGRLAEVLRHSETYDALRARVARRVVEILAYLAVGVVLFELIIIVMSVMGRRVSDETAAAFGMMSDYLPPAIAWMREYWWGAPATFAAAVLLATGLVVAAARWKLLEAVGFKSPLWGRLIRSRDLALFATAMAVRLGAGAKIPDALAAAEASVRSRPAARRVRNVRRRVEEGESLSSALFYESFFPRTLAWAVSLAEERGDLPDVFDTFARLYAAELDRNFGLLLQILTPLGLIALGNVAFLTAWVVLAPLIAVIQMTASLN